MAKSKRKKPRNGTTAPVVSKSKPEALKEPQSSTFRFFSKEWVQLATIVLVAFLLRLIHVWFMKANSPFFDGPVTDSNFYDKSAVAIANGDWAGKDVFFYNPLYPYFLGCIYTIFGHSYLTAKLIQITMGSMSCLLLYFIAKRLFSRTTGLIAASMAAGFSIFIFYDELLLSTFLDVFTFLAALLLLLRAGENPTIVRSVISGILLGISFISRPSVFPFVAAFWIVFSLRDKKKIFIVSRLAVYSVAAALTVLPVTVRNYLVGDDWVLVSSHTGYNVYFGNNPDAGGYFSIPKSIPRTLVDNPVDQKKWFTAQAEKDMGRTLKPSEVSEYWADKGFSYIKKHPADWMKLAAAKLLRILNEYEFSDNQNYYFSKQYSPMLRIPLVSFGLICPLALLGMVLFIRDFNRLGILYIYVAGYIGALLFFFVSSRYRMPLVPVFMMFAAHALQWVLSKLSQKDFKPFFKSAALLVGFTALVFVTPKDANKEAHFIDYYNVGNKYMDKGRMDDAIQAFSTSIQMHPEYISSHNNLASAYEKAGRMDDAISEWKTVLKMGETMNSDVHILRASEHIDLLSRKK